MTRADYHLRTPGRLPGSLSALLALTLLCGSTSLSAEPITEDTIISADRATFKQAAGTGVYEGNAELVQGQRQVNAERIELQLQDGDLRRVEATGNPVRLRDGAEINARAGRLVYDVNQQTITLMNDAHIEYQGRRFEGASVVYNLSTRDIEASGDGASQRVRLVIPAEDQKDATQ